MLSKAQITILSIIAVVMVIVFYAIGVATDLFANEAFSMFFILSREDAHTLSIVLLAGVGSGALLLMAILVRKGRVKIFSKKKNEPQEPIIASTNSADLDLTEDIFETEPFSKEETQEIETPQEVVATPNVDTQTSGTIVCPSCKRGFTTPLHMVDYTSKERKVMSYCPYCDTVLDSPQS